MIAVSFEFLSGRYHATPWGRHVNEGAVEWPPSPWRVLRALVATWRRTLPELSRSEVEPICRALVEPPEFILPAASTGHTRHFMPWFKKGPTDRTLVFDTFVAVQRGVRLVTTWSGAILDAAQREVLARILANLNTLGRSESWCAAELLERQPDVEAGQIVCRPLDGSSAPPEHDIIRLLCADGESALGDDYVVQIQTRTTGRGKNKKSIEEPSSIYDPTWNLCMETLQLHREKWSDPPGSRWVSYARPRDCFKIEPRRSRSRGRERSPIQVARYALDSSVLPLVTETLPVAEAARRALIRLYTDSRGRPEYAAHWSRDEHRDGRQSVPPSRVLGGKDERGRPLAGHTHGHFLPADEDGDGRLDHLTVYAVQGFGVHEVRAIDRLSELRMARRGEERHALRLLLIGMGRLDEYRPGLLRASREWVSATPYLATRYAKTRGRHRIDLASPRARAEFLIDDLRYELARRRPHLSAEELAAVTIEPLWDEGLVFRIDDRWRPIQFKRFRRKSGDDGGRRLSGAFRLILPEPLAGPLLLGHSSHFGMGLFLPVHSFDSGDARC